LVTTPLVPSGVMKPISGDVLGMVTSRPVPSSTSQSRQNSAAPFMSGQAVSRRNFLSPPNA